MDVSYPPEVLAFGATVRTWLADNLPPGWLEGEVHLTGPERTAFLADWTRRLRDGGWVCASWPREYGGRGLSTMETVVLAEEFARAGVPMRVSSLGELLVGPTILQWGSDDQKREFLPRILAGDLVWCQGFSEPEAGSDLASLTTSAVREGDELVVTGEKIWTSEAEDSDYMILLARTDPDAPRHAGISFLLLPMHQPGVTVHAIAQIDGTRGFNRVVLDGARCPLANVVGGLENGWKVAMSTLGFERGASAASSHHRFQTELDEAIDVARSRGITGDARVRQQLMAAWIEVQLMRINGYRTLTGVIQGRSDPGLTALELSHKLHWSEYDIGATTLAVDLEGPAGLVLTGTPDDPRRAAVGLGRREPLHHYPVSPRQASFFFARAETIYGGTTQVQRNVVAERALGLPRDPR